MPTIEDILSDVSAEIAQLSADVTSIGSASTVSAGLVKITDAALPADASVPTVAFLKSKNILGESGEAGGGLPQTQLDKVNALPPAQVLAALSTLPVSLNGLAGKIIAVNTTGNGYELIVAPTGGGGGTTTLPVNVAVDRFTGNNTATQFTLSQSPTNSNAVIVTVSGVTIDPALYSVSGNILTFTDPPPITIANAIIVRHLGTVAALADGSIVTVKVADRAITLAKIANGTPGKFLKFNASTGIIEETDVIATVADNSISTAKLINKNVTLAKIADGTPGKYLRFNPTTGTIEEADGAASGTNALILLNTQTASASSSISFSSTYLTTTYKHYIIIFTGAYGTIAPPNYLYLTTSTNNGSSYASSGYTWAGYWQNPGSGTLSGQALSNDSKLDINFSSGNFHSNANAPAAAIINLFDLSSQLPTFMIQYNAFGFIVNGGGSLPSGPTNNIKITPPSGTITGTFKLYGVL